MSPANTFREPIEPQPRINGMSVEWRKPGREDAIWAMTFEELIPRLTPAAPYQPGQIIDCPECGGKGYKVKQNAYGIHKHHTCPTCDGKELKVVSCKAVEAECETVVCDSRLTDPKYQSCFDNDCICNGTGTKWEWETEYE